MSVVNIVTGELLDAAAAERRAMKISLRLDTIADNYEAVMPMIREAIALRDDQALGYRSPGDYVSDRFGATLSRLGMEVRREVVRELTAAGLSTRAIAPVVGVNNSTVYRDRRVADATPEPETPEGGATDARDATDARITVPRVPRPPVTGIDGKTYTRPAPTKPQAAPRRPLPDAFFDAAFDLTKVTERIVRLSEDDRFPHNAEQVATKHRSDLVRAVESLSKVLDRFPS